MNRKLTPREQEISLALIRGFPALDSGPMPSDEAVERAARVLSGETTVEDAIAEIEAEFGLPASKKPRIDE